MLIKYKKNKRVQMCCTSSIPVYMKEKTEKLKPFESCEDCSYASHGFLCFREEGDCLKTYSQKLSKRREKK